MTDDELKTSISDGKEADQWLNHPVFGKAVLARKAMLIAELEKSKAFDVELREEVYRKIQALNTIKADLERMIRNGKQAEKSLIERIKEKFKSPE